jgi:deoxyribodipyrimidine photolyase-related protein
VIVLGDQLDPTSSALDGLDAARDVVWMAEVAEESTHVWSSKPRIALFLSAMRHHRDALRARGLTVDYTALDAPGNRGTLAAELDAAIDRHAPARLVLTAPGDHRVLVALREVARRRGLPLDLRDDRHFFATVRDFAAHAKGRKQLRLEYFYRELRERHGVLLDADGGPVGGKWNFDVENRGSFGADGPQGVPAPCRFEPDATTREVLALVEARFADHPGKLASFAWPVTPADAATALERFIADRLPSFGRYQDAMWTDEPWLFHSHLAAAMNLKLIDPRVVVRAAEDAYHRGAAPLEAVEGFIRQILGWREYVRGVYWTMMPDYLEQNALDAHTPLPAFYWTGDAEQACLRDAITQTLDHGYAHHIQRLMVTGLYALLLGVEPKQIHAWYLSVYVDAVEWVELPNVLGMSQFADGGRITSKPYVASGKYVDRMSNYCGGCRFDPAKSTGPDACPFTTLYWDFLMRHETRLAKNPRMVMQVRNLARLPAGERSKIQAQAEALRRPER